MKNPSKWKRLSMDRSNTRVMSREEHNSQPPGQTTDDKFPPPRKKCMQIPGGVAGGGGWAMIELTPALDNYNIYKD